MRVLKFGGTSVTGADRLEQVARIAAAARREDEILVVVSAQAGVTDRLLWAAEEASAGRLSVEALRGELGVRHLGALEALRLDRRHHDAAYRRAADVLHRRLIELTEDLREQASRKLAKPEVLARILAAGERLSAPLVAATLCGAGLDSKAIDATKVLRTRGPILDAEPDVEATRQPLRELLAGLPAGTVPVFTGFLGADAAGRTTLLGRGGSDTSATVLAAAAGAERVEIFTDVEGVMSADPRRHPNAVLLPQLSYEEAYALAATGAKVLHHKSIEPARAAGIPILVRSSFAPERPGTFIGQYAAAEAERRVA
jgi:aspartokinase/homoserine dehydrogenase 1